MDFLLNVSVRFARFKMNSNDLNKQIKTCESNDFFDLLETRVEFKIPLQLRNVLSLTLCNSAIALSRNILQTIDEIELFMRNEFDKKMIGPLEKIADYLGIYVKRQKDFQLLSGQKRMLCAIYEHCRKLYNVDDISNESPSNPTVPIVPIQYSTAVSSTPSTRDVLSVTQIQQSSNAERVVSKSEAKSGEPMDHVKHMFDDLYTWMRTHDSLKEVL